MGLEDALKGEAGKLIRRFELYARELRDEDRRRERRTGVPSRGAILRPAYWEVDRSFDPYEVRHSARAIARAIEAGLRNHDYRPHNPIAYDVPKPDGGVRRTSVFAVADATVSRRVYRRLMDKNRSRLSGYSYAYRDDLTVHDAIQNISADFGNRGRMFLAEYDFTKYFDSISHEYVWRVLDTQQFIVSALERRVLTAFLQTELQEQSAYSRYAVSAERTHGLPQGTSVSLFLANVAAWELDRTLERLGVGFARYADDTLIWSHDYARICEAVEALTVLSGEIGAPLNFAKSHGISIFTPDGAPAEFRPKTSVEFVGYRFTGDGCGMRESVARRIKERLSYLVWANLLEPLTAGHVVPSRVAPSVDRDYLVMIMQIRRYLYGDLSEEQLARLLNGRARRIHFAGVMSYFPLVSDVDQLKALDGWLLHTIATALKKRGRILRARGISTLPVPHGLSKDELLRAKGKASSGSELDLRIPSFVRIGTVMNRAASTHGANAVGRSGGPQHYEYES